MIVSSSSASTITCLYMAPAWASAEAMKRVPIHAPCAPSASAAASPRPSTIEPAAITGIFTASTICGISARPAMRPVCPPASVPCATTASSPPASAERAWLHRAVDIHDLEPGIVEFLDQMRRRHAEPGNERLRAALDDGVGGLLQRFRYGGQQIDAEGLVGQVAASS